MSQNSNGTRLPPTMKNGVRPFTHPFQPYKSKASYQTSSSQTQAFLVQQRTLFLLNMTNDALGLTMKISPEMAASLRQNPTPTKHTETLTYLKSSKSTSSEALTDCTSKSSLPYVFIHLESLVGYQPEPNEIESIHSQLLSAMWSRYQHSDSSSGDEDLAKPPPDFDFQVSEFFENGVAQFREKLMQPCEGGNAMSSHTTTHLIIQYPQILQSPNSNELIPINKLLSNLQQLPSTLPPLDFLKKLWKYLHGCSRSLFWKRDMAVELETLIREEQARLDYIEWTKSKRQAKLDSLYDVRETLVHQVELAQNKVQNLEADREDLVQEALEPIRRKHQQGLRNGGSMDAFGTTDLSFPDEFQFLGLRDDAPVDEEDDWGLDGEDYESPYESYDNTNSYFSDDNPNSGSENEDGATLNDSVIDIGQPVSQISEDAEVVCSTTQQDGVVPQNEESKKIIGSSLEDAQGTPALSIPFQRRKERRDRAKQRKQQERKRSQDQARKDELLRLEQQFRNKFTSRELVLAQTMAKALAEKMQKVEDLLESLQDEVWEAEEDPGQADMQGSGTFPEDERTLSLLDQVLAMILGATPEEYGVPKAEHYQFVQREHKSIVLAWKTHFGRLPPPAGGTPINEDANTLPPTGTLPVFQFDELETETSHSTAIRPKMSE